MDNEFVSERRKTHALTLSQESTQRCCPRVMRLLPTCLRGDKKLSHKLFWIFWTYWFCSSAFPGSNYRPALFCHSVIFGARSLQNMGLFSFLFFFFSLLCMFCGVPSSEDAQHLEHSRKTVWKQKLFSFWRNVLHFLLFSFLNIVKKDFMFQVILFGVIIVSWLILATFKIRRILVLGFFMICRVDFKDFLMTTETVITCKQSTFWDWEMQDALTHTSASTKPTLPAIISFQKRSSLILLKK